MTENRCTEDIKFRKIDGGYAFSAIFADRAAEGYVRKSLGRGWEATTTATEDFVEPVCRWGATRKSAVRSSGRAAHYGGDWWPVYPGPVAQPVRASDS